MQLSETVFQKYVLSLNRATISLVSSDHFLDVSTIEDMIMNFSLAVIGKLGFIYLLCSYYVVYTNTLKITIYKNSSL
jgi:hypothetical protein